MLDTYALETNTEISDASNVRIYGIKREGASPTVMVRNSRNVAIYSCGAMRNPVHHRLGGYLQFLEGSNDVMVAVVVVQAVKTLQDDPKKAQEPLILDKTDGEEEKIINWPDSVSIYKRGRIDDAPFRQE